MIEDACCSHDQRTTFLKGQTPPFVMNSKKKKIINFIVMDRKISRMSNINVTRPTYY